MTKEIEEILKNSKTIAMVGVSSLKKKEDPKNLKRKPSTIVMKYMQEFGYKVIPVNPFAVGEIIHGEEVFSKLEFSDYPLNEFGDASGFNYKTLASEKNTNLFHIEDVRASKLSDRINKNIDQSLFIGFLDFEITNLRFPRQ